MSNGDDITILEDGRHVAASLKLLFLHVFLWGTSVQYCLEPKVWEQDHFYTLKLIVSRVYWQQNEDMFILSHICFFSCFASSDFNNMVLIFNAMCLKQSPPSSAVYIYSSLVWWDRREPTSKLRKKANIDEKADGVVQPKPKYEQKLEIDMHYVWLHSAQVLFIDPLMEVLLTYCSVQFQSRHLSLESSDLWGFVWRQLMFWMCWTIMAVVSSAELFQQASWSVSSLPISIKWLFRSSGKVSKKIKSKTVEILKKVRSWNNYPFWRLSFFSKLFSALFQTADTSTAESGWRLSVIYLKLLGAVCIHHPPSSRPSASQSGVSPARSCVPTTRRHPGKLHGIAFPPLYLPLPNFSLHL